MDTVLVEHGIGAGLPIKSTTAITITPSTSNQIVSKGQYLKDITVKGDDNLVASNIQSGVTMFGVAGTSPIYPSVFADATSYKLMQVDMNYLYFLDITSKAVKKYNYAGTLISTTTLTAPATSDGATLVGVGATYSMYDIGGTQWGYDVCNYNGTIVYQCSNSRIFQAGAHGFYSNGYVFRSQSSQIDFYAVNNSTALAYFNGSSFPTLGDNLPFLINKNNHVVAYGTIPKYLNYSNNTITNINPIFGLIV